MQKATSEMGRIEPNHNKEGLTMKEHKTNMNEWATNVLGPMALINHDEFFGNKSSEEIAKALLDVICEISQGFPGKEARHYRRMLGELQAGAEKLLKACELIPPTYDISAVKEV